MCQKSKSGAPSLSCKDNVRLIHVKYYTTESATIILSLPNTLGESPPAGLDLPFPLLKGDKAALSCAEADLTVCKPDREVLYHGNPVSFCFLFLFFWLHPQLSPLCLIPSSQVSRHADQSSPCQLLMSLTCFVIMWYPHDRCQFRHCSCMEVSQDLSHQASLPRRLLVRICTRVSSTVLLAFIDNTVCHIDVSLMHVRHLPTSSSSLPSRLGTIHAIQQDPPSRGTRGHSVRCQTR